MLSIKKVDFDINIKNPWPPAPPPPTLNCYGFWYVLISKSYCGPPRNILTLMFNIKTLSTRPLRRCVRGSMTSFYPPPPTPTQYVGYTVRRSCTLRETKMYVRMYVCKYTYSMYVCVYVYMHVCMYVCTYIRINVCVYVCSYLWMYVCAYVCMYLYMCVCTFVCMYMCACVNVIMYVCMFICMYVCIRISVYVCM